MPFGLRCRNYRESSRDVLKFNLTRNVKYISVFMHREGSILQRGIATQSPFKALPNISSRSGDVRSTGVGLGLPYHVLMSCLFGFFFFVINIIISWIWWLLIFLGSVWFLPPYPSSASDKIKSWKREEILDDAFWFHNQQARGDKTRRRSCALAETNPKAAFLIKNHLLDKSHLTHTHSRVINI